MQNGRSVSLGLAGLLAILAIQVAYIAPAGAVSTCVSSGTSYTVTVCINAPADGATLSGTQPVTTTVTIVGGSTSVQRVTAYINGEYLLRDVSEPYTFDLPTEFFVDGAYLLEVEAALRDGFTTDNAAVNLTFANGVTQPPVNTNTFTPTAGTTPGSGQPFVMAATGDGAGGRPESADVVAMMQSWDTNLFAYLGDVYGKGTKTEFFNFYGNNGSFYSALNPITNPVVGNHEYENGAAPGYFDYWDNIADYYSYDSNGWHFIALNSTSDLGEEAPGSPQYDWLVADLAANTADCTIAYFHHPVLSEGPQGDRPALNDIWAELVDGGVDIVLTGHDHQYQRWTALDRNLNPDPDGTTEFVIGNGGYGIQTLVGSDSRLVAWADDVSAVGALRLELNPAGANFAFVDITGTTWDSGTVACNTAVDHVAPTTPGQLTATATSHFEVDLAWTDSTDNVGVSSYKLYRDGAEIADVAASPTTYTDNTAAADTTYLYEVEAWDAAGNASGRATATVTTPDLPASFTIVATEDSYVHATNSSSNYGNSVKLRVDGSPILRTFMKFDVVGLAVQPTQVMLRVYANSGSSIGWQAHTSATTTWSESTITWLNQPAFDSSAIGASGATSSNNYNDVDITGSITSDGTYTIVLTGSSNTGISLGSSESGTPPELVFSVDAGGPNNAPVATDVATFGDEDTVLNWTPDVHDVDTGDTLSCQIDTNSSTGAAYVSPDCSGGTYTPNADHNGTDTFTYSVSDGAAADTGTVTATVNPTNDTPTAAAGAAATNTDQAVTITLTGADVDGTCPLTIAMSAPPTNGTASAPANVSCTNGIVSATVEYTPNLGYVGTDTIGHTVSDALTTSAPATTAISVTAAQTQFTFSPVADAFVRSTSAGVNYGSANGLRVDASPVTNSYIKFDVVGLTDAPTSVTLSVRANSNSSTGWSLHTSSDTSWLESTIDYTNAPAFDAAVIASSGATTGGSYATVDLTGLITADGTYTLVLTGTSNTAISLGARESANPPQLVISTTPTSNSAPLAEDVSFTGTQDTLTDWTPVVSDVDTGDTLTCLIEDDGVNGAATVASDCSSGTYVPDAGFVGTDAFSYTVSDGAATDTGSVAVSVAPPATAFTINPAADAYVRSNKPTRNYGSSGQLRLDADPDLSAYVTFDVAGLTATPTSVVLRIYAKSASSTGWNVHTSADTNWVESTITYETAPSFDAAVVGSSGATTAGTYFDVDLTGVITDNGTYTLVLRGVSSTALNLASRETTNPPELAIAT